MTSRDADDRRTQRRRELAAAACRVILREGIEATSVRAIATEAGWSTGALRHYFPIRTCLLAYAIKAAA
ncbi:hypothetical protein GCM10012275_61300 [Longimycelium tulufanense]|uniref:HTH tetR-type domain-containing protein n=1 Tax=Longimycelium tulufanense TaxID=907463 RepID=A0A8J3CKH5_9PSEU|nr:TetR family transcriptional regulator [Longimycelium tulufanense]GGM82457.1 hypothetical protein GCM10012275_61300 [Longimycelium tulufanense]